MTLRLRAATSAASILIVAAGAAACGGGGGGGGSDARGSDAPKDASKSDFCQAFVAFGKETADLSSSSDAATKKSIAAIKDGVSKLQKVGTPSDIPADARAGFEVFVDTVASIPDDASAKQVQDIGSDVSGAKEKQVEAFVSSYVPKECTSELSGITGNGSSN